MNKLVKAKPLDNLEFLQWIKRYFDLHYGLSSESGPSETLDSECEFSLTHFSQK